ncbi:MAG: endolytic transglycosylase MltG [bacterium]|nr:endolytic transglycosylase MltG [bacterium]
MTKSDSYINSKGKVVRKSNLFLLAILLLLILAILKILSDVFVSNVTLKYAPEKAYLYVSKDHSLNKLIYQLEKGYYLENIESFKRLSKLVKLQNRMKEGRYSLKKGMSNFDLIKLLVNGRQEPLDLVFKYAERVEDLSGFFSRQLEVDSSVLLAVLSDTSIIGPLGFEPKTIVSMFIPNTYNFYWNTNAYELVNRMHNEYLKFWNAERIKKAMDLRLSQIQVSILASIVQKESNKNDEMPVIAGVYLNRIKLNMPLQADPTIIFAWNDKEIRRVTSFHTAIPSPYNTYTQLGLPPGPICVPSMQAIDAVLNVSKHNYLYFCAREDFSGYHSFAKSFEQHQQNATRYQRALNSRKVH